MFRKIVGTVTFIFICVIAIVAIYIAKNPDVIYELLNATMPLVIIILGIAYVIKSVFR